MEVRQRAELFSGCELDRPRVSPSPALLTGGAPVAFFPAHLAHAGIWQPHLIVLHTLRCKSPNNPLQITIIALQKSCQVQRSQQLSTHPDTPNGPRVTTTRRPPNSLGPAGPDRYLKAAVKRPCRAVCTALPPPPPAVASHPSATAPGDPTPTKSPAAIARAAAQSDTPPSRARRR